VSVRGRLAASLVVALALAAPASAAADAVSGTELTALAERAAIDDSARAQLLAVNEVDGHPVAVRAALADARGDELAERARLIAALVARAETDASPAADRAQAGEILDGRRFRGAELPRPLEKPLRWIGDRIRSVTDWINVRGASIPGGAAVLWTILSAVLLLAVSGVTATSIRRRTLAIERERAAALPESEDPAALERAAEKAEREGDYEHAVRLQFRAGLLRLDRRRILVYRPSLTTGEVARTIHAPAFAEVGARFDEIAYGGRPAEPSDAEAARRGWKDVLAQAAAR
jgi:uncharacterized protein DUF4129